MSEEVKIKISQPMFEVGELEVFDNNIHSIVEKYSKMQLHEKEQILTQRIIIKQEEEIEDLQNKLQQKENIIKEVREYITSYESIETIQQSDHNKNNKDLDYSTINEITRRYMIVHDKILEILDKGE